MTPAAIDDPSLTIPTFADFAQITDTSLYVPVPDGWSVGIGDVVGSTQAIAEGRYKAVNMAGVALISAVSNAIGHGAFPFVFGGDGASYAVPPEAAEAARSALAATATFVAEEYGLELRVAEIPVRAIREAGFDVRVARFAASPNVSYAVFSGGGLAWGETQVKGGAFLVAPAPAGTRPDLDGLSCRFEPMRARHGTVLSLIARPLAGDTAAYRAFIAGLVGLIERGAAHGASPVPPSGPTLALPPTGLDLEARTSRASQEALGVARLRLSLRRIWVWLIFRLGIRVGAFDPKHYLGQLVANSDYRKYDDGLRMTIDCPPALAAEVEAELERGAAAGLVAYGLHRQEAALMTCYTPSVYQDDHMHFVDGAAGGYAAAAASLKAAGQP